MELSQKILGLMKDNGYSYETLEKLTGLSKSTLQRKITGDSAKLKMTEIEKIARAFGMSAGELLEWNANEQAAITLNQGSELFALYKGIENLSPEDRKAYETTLTYTHISVDK